MPKLLINISQELYDHYMTCKKIGTNEPGYLCIPDETTDCIRNGMVIDENIIIDKEKDIKQDSEETHTGVIGYKAFDWNLTARNNFQYEIGGEYKMDESPAPCERGYHFVKNLSECYLYYPNISGTRICKIEALGEITTDDDIKFCTNHIRILEEIENPKAASNSGTNNTGYCNSGDCNAGDFNYGNYNSGYYNRGIKNTGYENDGDRNSGDHNIGYYNTGNYNRGTCNTGCYNHGNHNTGSYNFGDHNTGDFNYGDYNTGVFNTKKDPAIMMFDKPSNMTITDWNHSLARSLLRSCPFSFSVFINSKDMSDREKIANPDYKVLGGYNKRIEFTAKDRQLWWETLRLYEKYIIYGLPNFDPDIFEQCTGIKVDKVELNNWRESLK